MKLPIAVFAVSMALTAAQQKTTAEALFREALVKERAEGNLPEAIFLYERLIAEFSGDRRFVSQAMYQLALIYEKQSDPRAKTLLKRLSHEYGEVEPFGARAREKLARQANAPVAGFPETVLEASYELGSPDGRFVVYHKRGEDYGRLYVKELATRKERLLVDNPGSNVGSLAWSPDSASIAYSFNEPKAKANEIRTVQLATGAITNLGVRGFPQAWTETDEIYFYRPNYPAGGTDFSLAPAKGGSPRKVYFDPSGSGCNPVITPDATRVVACKDKKLFVVNLGTQEARPLTVGAGEEFRQQISADGRLVAFAANPDGNWALYLAPLNGDLPVKRPLLLANIPEPGGTWSGGDARCWWTRDGLLTYGMMYGESNVYRVEMDPKTGRSLDTPRRLTQDAPLNFTGAISPDTKSIAYWFMNGAKRGLAVMDSSGASERPLYQQGVILDVSWRSPEEILFHRDAKPREGEKSAIYALNIRTGCHQSSENVVF